MQQEELAPTQKVGYVDVKQPAKVKGRKLKTWRRRWAVLTLLNDLSRGGKPLAKLDLFENEGKWNRDSSDRVTFVLENVSTIRDAQSRTHPHALEIVQRQAVLALSGASEVDSYSWMLALQQMLVPSQVAKYEDTFHVSILPNSDAARCCMSGDHLMYVTPQHVELVKPSGVSTINWGLSTLVRFNQEGNSVIIIQCGPNSPTGESTFRLSCLKAEEALRAIRQCICQALLRKQNIRQQHQRMEVVQKSLSTATAESVSRNRKISASISEKGFQGLLDNTAFALRLDRSDSDSSGASMLSSHPFVATGPLSPVSLTSPTVERACNGLVDTVYGSNGLDNDGNLVKHGLPGNTCATTLVRNSSHCSLESTSPVIVRQKYNPVDVSQHGLVIDQHNASAATRGSPTNRSKRSSDSTNISISELEAVPERDENIERVSSDPFRLPQEHQHVPFDLVAQCSPFGARDTLSLLPTFEGSVSQLGGSHRRYSSLPAGDSGYSVIKDVPTFDVTRERASTMGDSKCFNVDSIKEQELSFTKVNNCVRMETKVESHYHEIDKKENPYSTIGGRSGRRRSSSLSDLTTVKYVSKTPLFENVYEDVDELRETKKRFREMSLKDEPPELPARPFSVSFSASSTQLSPGSKPRADTVGGTTTRSTKKKRFLFGKNKQTTSLDSDNGRSNSSNAVDTVLPNSDPVEFTDSYAPCATNISTPSPILHFSQFSKTSKSNMSRTFSTSMEELIHASDSSSFSELYADIVEVRAVQGKRRRSSDITPVKQHLLDIDVTTKRKEQAPTDVGREDLTPPALPQRRLSPPSKTFSSSGEDLINFFDNIETKSEIGTETNDAPRASPTSSPKVTPHQPPPASDPLISFFLNDTLFEENPLVTGTMHPSKPLVEPQVFTYDSKHFPFSTDDVSNTTNPFSTPFSMNNLLNNTNHSSSNSPVASWAATFDHAQVKVSPLNVTNPFTEDLFLLPTVESSTKGRVKNSINIAVEGNYLAMTKLQRGTGGRDQDNVYMMPSEKR